MICSLPISQRLLRGALAALLLLAGCTRDPEELLPFDGEERPATVTLSWSAPDMDVLSRAEAEQDPSKKVTGIWVGVFNEITGKRTGSQFFDEAGSDDEGIVHRTLENIPARSGRSRIVAVANYAYHYGVTSNEALQSRLGAGLRWKMGDLLAAVETWEEFRSIVVMPNDARDLTYHGANFLMSGVYLPKGEVCTGAGWIEANDRSVEIAAGANTLDGTIFLRRCLSHVNFIVTGGTTREGKAVALQVNRWRVHYKPMLSYLYERATNAADEEQYIFRHPDRFVPDFKPLESSSGNVYEHNYINTLYSNNITVYQTKAGAEKAEDDRNTYNFQFYQYENKHAGRTWEEDGEPRGTVYADREREYKEPLADPPSAAARAHDGTATETNTGIYKMLCETPDEPVTMAERGGPNANVNNFATFVEIDAQVSYEVTGTNGQTYTRTGDVTYIVHLGYCEGADEAAKALDFNCRRNTDYTYLVTVNGLESIVVEVSDGTERQPGAEGTVVDTSLVPIDLDAHYNVFNVGFTASELSALRYSLTTYFSGEEVGIVDSEETASGRAEAFTYRQLQELRTTDPAKYLYFSQFYSWISFKATRDAHSLRLFKDGAAGNAAGDGSHFFIPENDPDLLHLEGLKNYKANHIDPGKAFFKPDENGIYWFTCFAREYVYYYDTDGSQLWSSTDADGAALPEGQYREIGWHNYVDERPRVCNLSISDRRTSPDGESRHAYAKYRIAQQSIQTYYISDRAGVGDGTAVGAEHTNESYGLNLRWADVEPNVLYGSGTFWNRDNGRWNMWKRLADMDWNRVLVCDEKNKATIKVETDGTVKSREVAFQEAGAVPEVANRGLRNNLAPGDYYYRPATVYRVPMLASMTTADVVAQNNVLEPSSYDPNANGRYYKALYACMSRNRDINGNGRIDANEMRWYLPTAGKYVRMWIGRDALSDPLVPVGKFNPADYTRTDEHFYFHFLTSDGFLYWGEEGGSLGVKIDHAVNWQYGWNIRCVRNLGSVPQTLSEKDPVQPAYQHDASARIVRQTYYDPSILRLYKIENRGIDPHPINDNVCQPYKAFQYAEADCDVPNTEFNAWSESIRNNAVCGQYTEEEGGADRGTWRVPTHKELTILRRLHQYGEAAIFENQTNTCIKWLSCSYDMLLGTDGRVRYNGVLWNKRAENGRSYDYWTNSPAGADSYRVRCVRDVD